jgi:hypothetical protein
MSADVCMRVRVCNTPYPIPHTPYPIPHTLPAPLSSHLHKDLTHQRAVIGETMTHQFVTIAVRVLSVGVLDSDTGPPGTGASAVGVDGRDDLGRRDADALSSLLDTALRPLVEGLARVRQLEGALEAFQKRLVTRGESNEIKTFVSTVGARAEGGRGHGLHGATRIIEIPRPPCPSRLCVCA